MLIDQRDIAHLSDDDVRLLVLAVLGAVEEMERPGPSSGLADFWRRLATALIRARRERARLVALAEFDAMNDDGPGALVGPDDDPVSDALDELRRRCRGEALE